MINQLLNLDLVNPAIRRRLTFFGAALALIAVATTAPTFAQQFCVATDDGDIFGDPTFDLEITGSQGDSISMAGSQRADGTFDEKAVFGGAALRPDNVLLSWTKQGRLQLEVYSCDIDLATSEGTGDRTRIDGSGSDIEEITCELIAC